MIRFLLRFASIGTSNEIERNMCTFRKKKTQKGCIHVSNRASPPTKCNLFQIDVRSIAPSMLASSAPDLATKSVTRSRAHGNPHACFSDRLPSTSTSAEGDHRPKRASKIPKKTNSKIDRALHVAVIQYLVHEAHNVGRSGAAVHIIIGRLLLALALCLHAHDIKFIQFSWLRSFLTWASNVDVGQQFVTNKMEKG